MGPVIGGLCMSRSRDSIEGCPHYRGWLLVPVLLLYMSTVILCHFLRRKMRISFGTNQECYVWRTLLIGRSGFHSIYQLLYVVSCLFTAQPTNFFRPPFYSPLSLSVYPWRYSTTSRTETERENPEHCPYLTKSSTH